MGAGQVTMKSKVNIKQLEAETEAWFRVLEFIKQENVYLKNRLAGIMQEKINKIHLDTAETFQNNFINKDTIISLLKSEIHNHEKLLALGKRDGDYVTSEILDYQKRFREDLEKLTREFSKLKSEFNSYIAGVSNSVTNI